MQGVERRSADGLTPAQQLAAITARGRRADGEPAGGVGRLCARCSTKPGMHVAAPRRASMPRKPSLARDAFPRADLPDPDAAGARSRASVPVHPQQGPVGDLRPRPRFGRRADPRAGDDARRALPRFVRLPGEPARYIAIEALLKRFAPMLFPGYEVLGAGRLPRAARQRHRDRGGGRGPRPLLPPTRSSGAGAAGSSGSSWRPACPTRWPRVAARRTRRRRRDRSPKAAVCSASATSTRWSTRTGPTSSSRPSRRAFPSASANMAAIASRRSRRRTSSSTTRTRRSTWWSPSSSRRRPTPTSSRSSRRSTAPASSRRSSTR